MKVLLTRPATEAARTAERLRAAGFEAVLAPVLTVKPMLVPWPDRGFDAVLATSPRAMPETLGARAGLLALPLYAVGRQTAAAARAAGFAEIRLTAQEGAAQEGAAQEGAAQVGASLADLVRLTLPRGARLLYLAGHDRKPHLEARLAGDGYRLTVLETYRAEPVAAWPEPARANLAAGAITACLHFSRRSAALALDLAAAAGLEAEFLRLDHLCISADAAAPLAAAAEARDGTISIRIAARPDEASLIALLAGRALPER